MADIGYLPANGVAWTVHGDVTAMVGGIRSLLVQALQPRAMAAVAQHGDFAADFWGRLQRTSEYLLTVVYGSKEQADQMSAVVRAVHSRIQGIDTFTNRPYRADEPELLAWVHNATVESHLVAYQRYRRPLTEQDADDYVKQMRTLATLVGLSKDDVPASVSQLRAYFVSVDSELAVSPEAKSATRNLLFPDLPLTVRPLWSIPAAAAVESLPRAYQQRYGIPSLALARPAIVATSATLLLGLRILLPVPPIVEQARARSL